MFENIRNVITSLPMDRLRANSGGHIPSCPHMSPRIWLPWQRALPSNGALNIKSQIASIDFVINRFFMELFNTNNIEIVKCCQQEFCFSLPSITLAHRTENF